MGGRLPLLFIQGVGKDHARGRFRGEKGAGNRMELIQLLAGIQVGNTHLLPALPGQGRLRIQGAAVRLPGEEISAHAVALGVELLFQPPFLQKAGQVHGTGDILLSVIADGDKQGVFHARGFLHGPVQILQAAAVPRHGGVRLRAEGAVVMAGFIQIDEMQSGEIRPAAADGIRGQGRGVIAEIGLGDAFAQGAEALFPMQDIKGGAVAQGFQGRVFPLQGVHLRKAPAHRRIPAGHGPEDGTGTAAGLLHRVKEGGHPDMLSLPVPDPAGLGHPGLRGLILPHAGFIRLAAGDHGHMNRIGQGREDRFHPAAEGAFPQHSCQKPCRVQALRIRYKKRVQGNQYHFSHALAPSFPGGNQTR